MLPAGAGLKECALCPEMIAIPAGEFTMGSPKDEPERGEEEPQRTVKVDAFAIGRFEITFREWDACRADGGCGGYEPSDQGWGRGDRPVINVSWQDAQAYLSWLNGKVEGDPYRLATEAEWEYAARSGAETPFWWGAAISPLQANYLGMATYDGGGEPGAYRGRTVPVGNFEPNAFGVYQVHGNVFEWVQDCWHDGYVAAPEDGSAWKEAEKGDCTLAVVRGGSWVNYPATLRSAFRQNYPRDLRTIDIGFRVARSLAE